MFSPSFLKSERGLLHSRKLSTFTQRGVAGVKNECTRVQKTKGHQSGKDKEVRGKRADREKASAQFQWHKEKCVCLVYSWKQRKCGQWVWHTGTCESITTPGEQFACSSLLHSSQSIAFCRTQDFYSLAEFQSKCRHILAHIFYSLKLLSEAIEWAGRDRPNGISNKHKAVTSKWVQMVVPSSASV